MSSERGSSLAEALVGMALGALATAVLAASVMAGVRAFTLAYGVGAQVTATYDGLERLRGGPPGETDELLGGAPTIARQRERRAGRGRPDVLAVDSTWAAWAASHRFTIASEHAP